MWLLLNIFFLEHYFCKHTTKNKWADDGGHGSLRSNLPGCFSGRHVSPISPCMAFQVSHKHFKTGDGMERQIIYSEVFKSDIWREKTTTRTRFLATRTKVSSILDRLCCDLFGYRLVLLLSSTPARTSSGDIYQEFIAATWQRFVVAWPEFDADVIMLSLPQGPPPTYRASSDGTRVVYIKRKSVQGYWRPTLEMAEGNCNYRE